ncbi:MAG: hypothetical protein NUV84_05655 [Candidatus Uhrbacteria bacterium]|nr:hypothetical protein [Candidatus Uhrbacteria bacterium]
MRHLFLTKKELVHHVKQAILLILAAVLFYFLREFIYSSVFLFGVTLFGESQEVLVDLDAVGNILALLIPVWLYIKIYKKFFSGKLTRTVDDRVSTETKKRASAHGSKKKYAGIGLLALVAIVIVLPQFWSTKDSNTNLLNQSVSDGSSTQAVEIEEVSVFYDQITGEIYPSFTNQMFGMECLWSWSGDHGLGGVFTTDEMIVPLKEDRMGTGMITVDVICTNSFDGWYHGYYSDFD